MRAAYPAGPDRLGRRDAPLRRWCTAATASTPSSAAGCGAGASRRWARRPARSGARFATRCAASSYDAVIDLQGLTKSALVSRAAWLTVGGKRFAMANQTEGSSYEAPTRWVADVAIRIEPRVHAVTRSRELCARALGYELPGGPAVRAARDAAASRARRGSGPLRRLVHGTSRDDKCWPEAHWIELGRALIAQGFHARPAAWQRRRSASAASAWPQALGPKAPGLAAAGPGPAHRPARRLRRRDRRGQRPEPHRRGARPAARADLQLRHGLAHRAARPARRRRPRAPAGRLCAAHARRSTQVWQAWQQVAPR